MARIRPPRGDEFETLRSLERDAGCAFASIGMPDIAAEEPLPAVQLERLRAAGRAWVAVDVGDRPVAYLLSGVVDGWAHIVQVSVVSSHARRGSGLRG